MAAQSTVILCFDTETTPPWGKTSLRLVCRWVNDLVLSVHRLRWDVWIGPPKRMADPIHDWFVIINGGIPRLLKGEESNATLRLRGEETCHIEQTAITKWADIPMHKLLNQYHKFEIEESTDTASLASPGLNLQRFPNLWTYTATYRDAGDATILPQGTSKTSIAFRYNTATKRAHFHWVKLKSDSENDVNTRPDSANSPKLVARIYIVRPGESIEVNHNWVELYEERQSNDIGLQNDPSEDACNGNEFLEVARGLWRQISLDFNDIQTPLENGSESLEDVDAVPLSMDMVGTILHL
ncbi:hypothetical protein VCV18_011413 [Metarhizium anisopliae]